MKTVNKKQALLINIGIVFGALIFIGLVFELALRAVGYQPFKNLLDDPLGRSIFIRPSENPERIFEAKANTQGAGWGTEIRINKHGFRGREYEPQKPKNTIRVAVIGDSITFGNNLSADENYPAKLNTLFKNSHQKVEVLNFGLGGYDTLQAVATLEDIGLQFDPDIVVLGYCINDIGIASGNLNYIKRIHKYGQNPIYYLRIAQFIRNRLDKIEIKKYMQAANQEVNIVERHKTKIIDVSNDQKVVDLAGNLSNMLKNNKSVKIYTKSYASLKHIGRLRFGLEKLKQLQDSYNFEVVVVVFPYLLEDSRNDVIYQAMYDVIRYEMQRLDFDFLELYQPFSEPGLQSLTIKVNDGIHPNAIGHQITADKLFEKINDNYLK